MPDFNQPVDLKEKMAQKNKPFLPPKQQQQQPLSSTPAKQIAAKPQPAPRKKAEEIDEMFDDGEEINQTPAGRKEMQSIARAPQPKFNEGALKKWLLIVAGILAVFLAYYFFTQSSKSVKIDTNQPASSGWYAVKLMNNETYYGQIKDLTTDPVVMTNVYYNYDEINKDKTAETKPATEPGALRLVKRGKENYGPDGTMSIVRMQLVLAEPLKADSKVLKAILEYEKKP